MDQADTQKSISGRGIITYKGLEAQADPSDQTKSKGTIVATTEREKEREDQRGGQGPDCVGSQRSQQGLWPLL